MKASGSEHTTFRPPKNPGLLQLIRAKRERHWKPTAEQLRQGFRGWHQRGYLPHFDAPDVTQMVTVMLADTFPVKRRAEWEPILKGADTSLKRRKLEAWLDRGHGQCWLRRPEVAQIVEDVVRGSDGDDYQLEAWVVMPNHIHVVVNVWNVPLSKLISLWKGKSARLANLELRRIGKFWQEDYFDTVIRDEAHLRKAVRYTEQNPSKSGLVKVSCDWAWGSARWRDEFARLPCQRTKFSE
jgi:REP element-mobilizing transposase RayT